MQPIDKKPILIQVVHSIEKEIHDGKYAIGDKLPSEFELCNSLGVGRSTVREAYRTLQTLGYLEIKRGKGYFLKQLNSIKDENLEKWFAENKTRLSDLMEVRFALEPLSVRLAIERGTKDQIDKIVALNEAFKEAALQQEYQKLALLDEDFHTAIVKASNNEFLMKINQVISASLKDYRIRSFSVKGNASHAVKPHEKILDRILRKNVQEAVAAMEEHLLISMEDIEDVISNE